jgi:DNA-nicking Smr family endonuclease
MWKALRQFLAPFLERGRPAGDRSPGLPPDRPGRDGPCPAAEPLRGPAAGPPTGGRTGRTRAAGADEQGGDGAAARRSPKSPSYCNRVGVPVIDPRADLAALLAGGAETPNPPVISDPSPAGGGGLRREQADPAAPRRNRVGIPILDSVGALDDRLAGRSPTGDDAGPPTPAIQGPGALRTPRQYDRHGLPRLDPEADLGRLLDPGGPAPGEDFARLLEDDLRGASATSIRRRKRDRLPPAPLPLAKRLARYPDPQGQLDLHGFTAVRADQRAQEFIRTMRHEGVSTLRIIVGRGRHSEAGAVLPDVVEDRLVAMRQTGEVVAFRWEKRDKRRSGAVIVYLGREKWPGE